MHYIYFYDNIVHQTVHLKIFVYKTKKESKMVENGATCIIGILPNPQYCAREQQVIVLLCLQQRRKPEKNEKISLAKQR